MTPARARDSTSVSRGLTLWLGATIALVFVMVVVGGITRLTGSGLSIVDWRPVTGALPPLGEEAWQAEFLRYQGSPQFAKTNHWMALADFKQIYFWEYLHRLLGRLVGVVFAVPWCWFLVTGRLGRVPGLTWKTTVALALGGAQGFLGWWMVASGLVDIPRVSHFRLAAHLTLAFAIAAWLFWLLLGLRDERRHDEVRRDPEPAAPFAVRGTLLAFLVLLGVQLVYGAFVAGTRGGTLFSDFPQMGGQWFPRGIGTGASLAEELLENPVTLHAAHRWLGYGLFALAVGLGLAGLLVVRAPRQRRALVGLTLAVLVQVTLGALTVVFQVPLLVAVAHQAVAFLVLGAALYAAHACGLARSRRCRERTRELGAPAAA